MAVTYSDIFDDVNERLDNDLEPKSAEFPGDGVAEILHLPDKHICSGANAPVAYVIGEGGTRTLVEDVDYAIDYQSGYVTLYIGPVIDGETLYIDYNVRHWSENLLWRLANVGIHHIYPHFYAVSEVTPTADDSGDYPLEDPDGRIIAGVIDAEDVGSPIYHLSPFRDYRVLRSENEAASMRVFSTLTGTLVVRLAVHPDEFSSESTSLGDLGLPDRMREPLVLYMVWKALSQKMPARSRSDNVTVLNTEGKSTFFDQARMIQLAKLEFDTELERNHMRDWTVKGL